MRFAITTKCPDQNELPARAAEPPGVEEPSPPEHVAPAHQPVSVYQLTGRFFSAYTVENGSVHLGGCTLEDRLFLKLRFVSDDDDPLELILDDRGEPLDASTIEELGMNETVTLEPPPELVESRVAELVQRGRDLANERTPESHSADDAPPRLESVTYIWCKYAEGKLELTIGRKTLELRFAGWTSLVEPPPFVCPLTHRSTYHLAATDDGRIVAAEEIEACEQTGRRVLAEELVTCSATDRRVLPELTVICPVSDQPVLEPEQVGCSSCRERVSPTVLSDGRCQACRDLVKIDASDPRLQRLRDRHAGLCQLGGWRMSETASVWIMVGSRWLNHVMVVVRRSDLEPVHIAKGRRFSSSWTQVERSQWQAILEEPT